MGFKVSLERCRGGEESKNWDIYSRCEEKREETGNLPGTTDRDASNEDGDNANICQVLTYTSSFYLPLLDNIIREFILFSFHRSGQTAKEVECQSKQFMSAITGAIHVSPRSPSLGWWATVIIGSLSIEVDQAHGAIHSLELPRGSG